MSENETKKNATERLEDLETTLNQVIQHIQPLEQMAKELMGAKEALKLLNNKLDATVKAVNEGGQVTEDRLNDLMIQNNVRDLTAKVTSMVTSGLLVSTDTVGKESFVVINEADPSGKVVNPRMQFLVSTLQDEGLKAKLDGAKAGSNILVGDQGASINILEAYNVSVPQASNSEATTVEASPTTESTSEAVTSDSSSAEISAQTTESPPPETATA